MKEFKGKVKRNLDERKFNSRNKKYCATGGVANGCPFFRLNNTVKWVCTLYRSFPKLNEEQKNYERVNSCINNEEPPIKRTFIIHCNRKHICEITAISEEEARSMFNKSCDGDIEKIVVGNKIDYENTI